MTIAIKIEMRSIGFKQESKS